jgi:CO/xanthine dehydrogenase Mo-binding subunit
VSASENLTGNVFGATLSRGTFVKGTGALVVGLSFAGMTAGGAVAARNEVDATSLEGWLTINPDNTVTMRTGKVEFGQGSASAAYAQIVAEELNLPYTAITKVIMGDTDRTPDGGLGAGFLGGGATNLRKVAAYTYQALLGLASTQLGVPTGGLSVTNGVVSGGGKSVSYGDLVKNQQLKLSIPITGTPLNGVTVSGTPPTKPVSQYTVIGTSQPMPTIPPIVTGTATFVANMRLPGLLNARIVRPKTLGSTLVSVGKLDKKVWPTTQLVVKGNLVAVLSPNEWEAIGAAAAVAGTTKWSDWKGLAGSGNLVKSLREANYGAAAKANGASNRGNVGSAMSTAVKRISASYLKPYQKHGPIGPSVAVADVRKDGTTYVWAHSQYPQHLRKMIASVLETSVDNVVVRILDGSGHYGRSNPGPDGAEADAAILSREVGAPVKVQWMRQEDMVWGVSTFPQLADIQVGLDTNGDIVAFQADYHQTGRYDGRGLGALLAGLPPGALEDGTPTIPQSAGHYSWVAPVSTNWAYEKIPNLLETSLNTAPLGTVESPYQVGLRVHSMRTPAMREQNFAVEGMINEVAASVGVDPIEYRMRHTADQRLIDVFTKLKASHGWETRPSPNPKKGTGDIVKGRGMGVMLRSNGRWAAAADVTVNLKTGKVTLDKYTVVLDVGIVINPLQLTRITEGGTVQGISEVTKEAVAYDRGTITSSDWVKYPIVRFNEIPEIKVELLNNPSVGSYLGAGEGSNGLPYVALPAAVFDAIGKFPRNLPLRPANIRALLQS